MNDILQSLDQFLYPQSTQISLWGFVVNLLLAAVLAYLLGFVYVRFGQSLSNRRRFAWNFLTLSMTTMFIITVVKSSLALSLGLVGALSIVRYRAAIKEPEELAYIFLAIAIGLGLGADQRAITVVAFAVITLFIAMRGFNSRADRSENLHLTVTSHSPGKVELDRIVETLEQHCTAIKVKRFDDSGDLLEASFVVEYDTFSDLQSSKNALQTLGDSVKVTFVDTLGLV